MAKPGRIAILLVMILVFAAVCRAPALSEETWRERASSWLLAQARPDGSLGKKLDAQTTALTLAAIRELGWDYAPRVVDFLATVPDFGEDLAWAYWLTGDAGVGQKLAIRQQIDGSWFDDPFLTALIQWRSTMGGNASEAAREYLAGAAASGLAPPHVLAALLTFFRQYEPSADLVSELGGALHASQNPDGSWGEGAAETAWAVWALGRSDQAARDGLHFLVAAQNADGGWGESEAGGSRVETTAVAFFALAATEPSSPALQGALDYLWANAADQTCWYQVGGAIALTSEALQGLIQARVTDERINRGLGWLLNMQAEATADLAGQIAASRFTDLPVAGIIQRLAARQNADSGFGAAEGVASDTADSALALQALNLVGANPEGRRACQDYLVSRQLFDGSWSLPRIDSVNARLYLTSLATLAIADLPAAEPAVRKAVSWLIAQRNPDRGWGAGGSCPWLTALAYLACVRSGVGLPAGEETRELLIGAQAAAGSWQNSIWATALVLRALLETETNLRFAGGIVFEPSQVVAGEPVKMKVTVANDGGSTVAAIPIVFAEAKPEGYFALGPAITLPVLQAGERTAVEFPDWLPTVGQHQLAVIIDPDGVIQETSKGDNQVETEVWAAPALAPDIYMMEDGLALTPAKPVDGETVQLKARIRNRGTIAATGVLIRFFDGAGQIGADQTTAEIAPNGSAYVEATWVAREGDHVLKVEMDPDNALAELDESNNEYIKPVPVSLVRPPEAPRGLAATAEDAAVNLSWQANLEEDIAGYHVYRNGVRVNSQLVLNTEYYDDGLVNGTVYTYTVTAVNTHGLESTPSEDVTASPTAGLLPLPYLVYPGSSHRTASIRRERVGLIGVSEELGTVNIEYGAGRTRTAQALADRALSLAADDGAAVWENASALAGGGVGLPTHAQGWDLGYEADQLPQSFNPPFLTTQAGPFTESVANGLLTLKIVGSTAKRFYEYAPATVLEGSVEWSVRPRQLATDGRVVLELRNGSYGAAVYIYNNGLSVYGAIENKLPLPTFNQFHTYQMTLRHGRVYLYVDGRPAGAFAAQTGTARILRFGCQGTAEADWDCVRYIGSNRRPLPREGFVRWRTLDFRCPVNLTDLDWDAEGQVGAYVFTGRARNMAPAATYQYETNPSNIGSDPNRNVLRDGLTGDTVWMNWSGDAQILFDLGAPSYLQTVRCWVKGAAAAKAPDRIEVFTSPDGMVYQKRGVTKNIADLSKQWIETKVEATWARFVRVRLYLRSGSLALNEVELIGGRWSPASRGQALGTDPVTFCLRLARPDDLSTPVGRGISCTAHAPAGQGVFSSELEGVAEGRALVKAADLEHNRSTSMDLLADYHAPLISLSCPARGYAGEPYLLDAGKSYDSSGLAWFSWDFDDGGMGDGEPEFSHVFPFAGTFLVSVTVWDQAGNCGIASRAVEMIGQTPRVICVPWHAGEPHPTWSGKIVTLKGTCKGFTGTVKYTWDFGDGTSVSGTVTNPYAIGATHAYTGTVGTPIRAILTVEDTDGHRSSDQYDLMIMGQTPQVERDVAIDEGLWWMHTRMTRKTYAAGVYQSYAIPYGYWTEPNYGPFTITPTACGIEAFENNGHLPAGDPEEDPYVETVRRGLAYLPTTLSYQTINMQLAGDPDTNHNGYGLGVASSQAIYEIGMLMMAIVGSQSPGLVAETGPATYVRGRTYRDILQDLVDYCAWAQTDPNYGNYRGGWRYSANSGNSDNSVTQWPVIGLAAAETAPWNITAPPFVKSELAMWLKYSQSADGGFGYAGPGSSNYARTGAGLASLAYCGRGPDDPAVKAALGFLDKRWVTTTDHYGNFYAMYAIMKGCRLFKPQVAAIGEHDWMWELFRNNTYPHELILDLGQSRLVTRVNYLPRQNSNLGWIKQYEVYVSNDVRAWGDPVAAGTAPASSAEVLISCAPKAGRYVRFRGLSELYGRPQMAAAEIKIFYNTGGESAPEGPTGLAAIPAGDHSLVLGWSDQAADETGFRIERRRADNQNWLEVAVVGPDVHTYTDTGLEPETYYVYRVRSYNAFGPSSPSNSATGRTLTAEGQVLGTGAPVTASASSNTSTAAKAVDGDPQTVWASASTAPPHYINLDLGAVYKVVGLRYLVSQSGPTGRVKDYEVYASTSTANWGASDAAGTLADTGSWQAVTFPAVDARYLRLRGLSFHGGTNQMAAAEIVPLLAPERSALAVPGFVAARLQTAASAEIGWEAAPPAVTGLTLQRRIGSAAWANYKTLSRDAVSFVDTGLVPDTAYSYRLVPAGAAGSGPASNEATVRTPVSNGTFRVPGEAMTAKADMSDPNYPPGLAVDGVSSTFWITPAVTPVPGGMVDYFVDKQFADGHWNDLVYVSSTTATPWAILILTETLFNPPPVAVLTAVPSEVGIGVETILDGSGSYHLNPDRRIVKYEWDFEDDDDDVYDYSETPESAPDGEFDGRTGHTYAVNPGQVGTYTARLRVTDDDPARPQSDDTPATVTVSLGNHPPVAIITGPDTVFVGDAVQYSGEDSFDQDAADPYLHDSVALYGWELDCIIEYDFNEADTVLIERQWTAPGQYTIGLRVTDEYGATNVDWKTVTVKEPPNAADLLPEELMAFRQGEDCRIEVDVRNAGLTGAAENWLRFYDGDPLAGGVLVGQVRVAAIGASNSAHQSLLWPSPRLGAHRLYAVVDAANEVSEADEGNNTKWTQFDFKLPKITVKVAPVDYWPNEEVKPLITLTDLANLTCVVTVRDAGGTVIDELARFAVPALSSEERADYHYHWLTDGRLAGDYLVRGELIANGGEVVAWSEAPFTIHTVATPADGLKSRVATDKRAYGANEDVRIQGLVSNLLGNYGYEQILVKQSVIGPDGRVLAVFTRTIGLLMPLSDALLENIWPTGENAPGPYRVVQQVTTGQVTQATEAAFIIVGTDQAGQGLSGTIAAQPTQNYYGQKETFLVAVRNDGNTDLLDRTVRVSVISAATRELAAEMTIVGTLPHGAEAEFVLESVITYPVGLYLAVLSVDTAAGPRALARTTFEVIDSTPPVSTIHVHGPQYQGDHFYVGPATTYTVTAVDDLSGVDYIEIKIDDGKPFTYVEEFGLAGEGKHLLAYHAKDRAGNWEDWRYLEVHLDATPPVTTHDYAYPDLWANKPAAIAFSATDNASGAAKTEVTVDGREAGAGLTFGTEGVCAVQYRSSDHVENIEDWQGFSVQLDFTPPVINCSLQEGREFFADETITVSYSAVDALSGVAEVRAYLDGREVTGQDALQPGAGNHTYLVVALDKAGNEARLERHILVKIRVTIEVKPEAMQGNKGRFTVFAWLPAGVTPEDFAAATCEGAVLESAVMAGEKIVFKFRRDEMTTPLDTIFVLRITLKDGTVLEGMDDISKVIVKD